MTVVTFHVGEALCGAEVQCVQEVLRQQELTPIPLAAEATPGLLHLRGQILTGIDLRSVFGLEPCETATKRVCVIVRDGDSAASLLADRIGEVMEVNTDAIQAPPAHWNGPMRDYLTGVTDQAAQLLHLLDVPRILAIESITGQDAEEAIGRGL
jgi:purine-binding chemotaxis protein CheW